MHCEDFQIAHQRQRRVRSTAFPCVEAAQRWHVDRVLMCQGPTLQCWQPPPWQRQLHPLSTPRARAAATATEAWVRGWVKAAVMAPVMPMVFEQS
jgi:hypothetical protein